MRAWPRTKEERVFRSQGHGTPFDLGGRVQAARPVVDALPAVSTYREPPAATGGTPGPTVTIAAADSLYPERADLVCDGTNDYAEFVTARDLITDGPSGQGRIVLLDGFYEWGATGVDFFGAVDIVGLSSTAVVIDVGSVGVGDTAIANPRRVEGIEIGGWGGECLGTVIGNAYETLLCVIFNAAVGLTTTSGAARAVHNVFETCRTSIVAGQLAQIVANAIRLDNANLVCGIGGTTGSTYGPIIADNQFTDSSGTGLVAVQLYSGWKQAQVHGNRAPFGTITVAGTEANVQNNRFQDITISAGGTRCMVINNDYHGGSFTDSGTATVLNLDGSANNWNRA